MTGVGSITMSGDISMGNSKRIYFKNTSGNGVSALLIDTSNNFVIGEGMAGYNTYLRGSSLTFQTGSSHTERMTIDANGRVYVVNGEQGLRIGDALLSWDSENTAIKVSAVDGSGQVNFYATGGVSTLGAGNGSSIADWLKDNNIQIKRLGIGIAPSSSYILYVKGASYFDGNVGIGTASPTYKLDVNGVARATELRLTYGFYIDWNSTNDNAYSIGEDGSDIYAEGDWYGQWASPSDVRLKDIDQYLDSNLEDIALAPIFSFRWKDKPNKPLELGTSAQYWKAHLPYGVKQTNSGYLAIDYGATALAAAVFTARKVVDHESRIKQLEERIAELNSTNKES
jgi:hypothetical protein